jgi:hypothetical protein
LYVDLKNYINFNSHRKSQLAFWTYYWTVLSGAVPYLDLPTIGWDPISRSGRGIYQSRYKGKGLLYLEAEYRFDITRNGLLGGVVFSNVNSVAEQFEYVFKYANPGAGCGLRFKVNKITGMNFVLDVGISKDYWTVYINLSEAF